MSEVVGKKIKNHNSQEFPASPMVRILGFH